jgi:voltage-dependent potassium channel beta subunit
VNYRRLGKAGLKLSELSLGAWVTYGGQVGEHVAAECMAAAHDAGVNFFDNAESYAGGNAEIVMGKVLKQLGWQRASYIVSSKFYWGLHEEVHLKNTLNRKYLMQAIDGSLKRLQLDFVDLIFCHRPDPETPIEETVWAMHNIIEQGKALYWGTSEWRADQIFEAYYIADKYHLHKPQMEQPHYNMFMRERVEKDLVRVFRELGLGATIFSPLASGLLSGKYNEGIPAGSRATLAGMEWMRTGTITPERIEKVKQLQAVASELGCTVAQLALAWCLKNPHVTTVITGASRVSQVHENMKALDVLPKLTADVMERIDAVLGNEPNAE